jgi:hypothetical protein
VITIDTKHPHQIELRYQETAGKEPLHLLLDVEIPYPKRVQQQVDEIWQKNHPEDAEDNPRLIVVDYFEQAGREVFIQAKTYYRYLFARNYLLEHPELVQQYPDVLPAVRSAFANPVGKIALPPTPEHPEGLSVIGIMRESGKATAIGGYMDVEDMTDVILPSGDNAIVPLKPEVQLNAHKLFDSNFELIRPELMRQIDQKRLRNMLHELDQVEKEGEKIDTPLRRCLQREGWEEALIDNDPMAPIGKCVQVEVNTQGTSFGFPPQETIREHWYVCDLKPRESISSIPELHKLFKTRDDKLAEEGKERELLTLLVIDNGNLSVVTSKKTKTAEQAPAITLPEVESRPSVGPVTLTMLRYTNLFPEQQQIQNHAIPAPLPPFPNDVRKKLQQVANRFSLPSHETKKFLSRGAHFRSTR